MSLQRDSPEMRSYDPFNGYCDSHDPLHSIILEILPWNRIVCQPSFHKNETAKKIVICIKHFNVLRNSSFGILYIYKFQACSLFSILQINIWWICWRLFRHHVVKCDFTAFIKILSAENTGHLMQAHSFIVLGDCNKHCAWEIFR